MAFICEKNRSTMAKPVQINSADQLVSLVAYEMELLYESIIGA